MSDDLIVHGPPLWVPIPEVSLGKQIYDSLINCTDDEVAYVDFHTSKQLLYKNFFQQSCQLANCLQKCGYKINDVIGICSENNINFFIPVVSALYLGIVTATLNSTYTDRELLHSAGITKPKIIFCSKSVIHQFQKLKDTVNYIERIIILDSDEKVMGYDTIKEFINKYCDKDFNVENFKPVDLDPFNHLAVVLCSSGTTGLPKAVMVTHDNVSMRFNQVFDPRISKPTNIVFGLLPFYHGYGFMTNLSTIIQKKVVVVLKTFEEVSFLRCIEKYRINVLYLVPPLMLFLAKTPLLSKYDLSSVDEVCCGAAPLSMRIEAIIKKRLPNVKIIRQGYGLTEATLAVLLLPIESSRSGSSGKVVPGMSCIVRDVESGKRLGPNKVGELCFKGRLVTKGYYGNEEATNNLFSSDGWLLTGDLGYYDEQYYFYIVDRLKELIKYKGFQVAPAELEAILIEHPEIKDAAVIGKLEEDVGELPTAFVVRQRNSQLTEQQVKDYVAKQVSRPKHLHGGVYFIDEIPKTSSGKILRRQLRELISKYKSKL